MNGANYLISDDCHGEVSIHIHLIILIHLNGKPGVRIEHPTFAFLCLSENSTQAELIYFLTRPM